METYDVRTFNQKMRTRTKSFAVEVYKTLKGIRWNDLNRIIARQLIRSSASLAANYSSATRGRSEAEFYAKLCIVVEECDEVVFWLDFLTDLEIVDPVMIKDLKREAMELLNIFSTIRKKLKNKRAGVS
jgi:four helix bundle protein